MDVAEAKSLEGVEGVEAVGLLVARLMIAGGAGLEDRRGLEGWGLGDKMGFEGWGLGDKMGFEGWGLEG